MASNGSGRIGRMIVTAALLGTSAHALAQGPGLRVVSTRPDMVSGGDVLVALPGGQTATDQRVTLNGADVTAQFRPADNGERVALLTGLKPGANEIALAGAAKAGAVTVQNHPIEGPIFSGPQQQPYICETKVAGLGDPVDANCSVPTQVAWYYFSKNPAPATKEAMPEGCTRASKATNRMLCKLADPAHLPGDVDQTTTIEGKTVPYVVRVERGTINRAIYEIAMLGDAQGAVSTPWKRTDGWNGRLVYTFGGGQAASYHQGSSTGGVIADSDFARPAIDLFLRRGYAVASSSMNVLQTSGNDVISAETALMVKEHFSETYGAPRYTIGYGGSGGAIQQYMIAQNYPGILDGLLPSYSYSDIWTGLLDTDQRLFFKFFRETPKNTSWQAPAAPWATQEDAVIGGGGPGAAIAIGGAVEKMFPPFAWICPAAVAKAIPDKIYDPVKNVRGIRCTLPDNEVNQLGIDTHTGFAYQPLYDNVGIQYGLVPYNNGLIDAEQFLELNEKIGGKNADGVLVTPYRDQPADPRALALGYRKGRVFSGLGVDQTPMVILRSYGDLSGDIHTRVIDFVIRARMKRANGRADNAVIYMGPPPNASKVYNEVVEAEALTTIDKWLERLQQAPAGMSRAQQVRWARPAGVDDTCWDKDGTRIVEHMELGAPGKCATLYPTFTTNRMNAGMPIYSDILKCQLKAPDPRDYKAKFTPEQWARVQRAFPDGVCDWSKPGVGQARLEGTWLRYDKGPIRGAWQPGKD